MIAVDAPLDVEALPDPLAPAGPESGAAVRIGQESLERRGQRVHVERSVDRYHALFEELAAGRR